MNGRTNDIPLKKNKQLRHVLAGLIVALGIISITLVYLTSRSYLDLSIAHERTTLDNVIAFKAKQIFETLKVRQTEMGSHLQREGDFRKSYLSRDLQAIQDQINLSFHRIFVTGGLLDIKTITVYDQDLGFLNQSSGSTSPVKSEHTAHCPDLIADAKARTGPARLQVISQLCIKDNQAIQSVLVPIGGLQALGYLQINVNPTYSLEQLENELAMPVQLRSTSGELLYASKHWPGRSSSEQLFVDLDLLTSDAQPLLRLYVAQDITALVTNLGKSRNRIMALSFAVVAIAVLIMLIIVNKALKPLTDLKTAAANVARGQYTAIGDHSSYEEIATPIASFNKMAEALNQENRSRTRAQEALKQATLDAERLARKSFEEKKFTQITLNSINDGVITVNTDSRVLFMNPAAAKLTGFDLIRSIGRSLEEVFPVNEALHQLDTDSISAKSNQNLRLRQADGNEIEIEAISSTMHSPNEDLIGRVIVFSDVTKQRELTRRLSYAATHDPLTGLINRSEFERRLEETIRIAHMDNSEHALCYMDLDQFKIINDTCGHIAGDELLRQISGLIRSHVSRRDTLGRLGGDEFGLLMENCGLDAAQDIAGKLLTSIRDYQFVWEDHTFNVGCSIGIVKFDGMGENMAKIMSAADTACYVAKDRGRNRVETVRTENADLEKRQGEMQWVLKINTALQEENLVLYRQRIVPCQDGDNKNIRYEILVRMKEENGDLILPGLFMPAAERFDLIAKIDHWVFSATIKWLKNLPDEDDIAVAINLSGASITNTSFMEFVVREIQQTNINPECICFEITETAAIANLSHAQRFMKTLAKLGCQFALDDFGSGLSSFAYLKSLPVQYLKIDGLFIRNIHQDPVDLAMIKSINDVGHALGLLTVAEFVEKQETIEILQDIGIDYLQGYAIGEPEPLLG